MKISQLNFFCGTMLRLQRLHQAGDGMNDPP
jgi:hypothetical protein